MAKIGYDNTLNRSGGPSPLKGIFGAAVGAAKGTTKKKSKTKAKNAPKRNKGEGIGAYSKRLAESQRSGSGESSGDAVIAYTPLYSTDPDKKKSKQEIKTEERLRKNEEKKKQLEQKFANKSKKKIERQKRLNSNKEVRDLKRELRYKNKIAKWGTKNKRNDEYPVPSKNTNSLD